MTASRGAGAKGSWSRLGARLLSTSLLIGSAGAAYLLATGGWPWTARREAKAKIESGESDRGNPFAAHHGRHLIAYALFASDCGWSQLENSRLAIRSLRSGLRLAHGTNYAQITVVGVDLDDDLAAGLAFLADIGGGSVSGAFDQILVGGSWLNDKASRLIWSEQLIPAALPQILVVERTVGADDYHLTHRLRVGSDRVLVSIVGEWDMRRWVKQGYRLNAAAAPAANGSQKK